MKNQIGTILAALCIAYTAYVHFGQKKEELVVVQQEKLIQDFKGMQEASDLYSEKLEQWRIPIQKLEAEFTAAYSLYQQDSAQLAFAQRREIEMELTLLSRKIREQQEQLELKAQEEDTKISMGVMNKVNSMVKKYAQEKGYKIVVANTVAENIMYAEGTVDITEELVKQMNEWHVHGEE